MIHYLVCLLLLVSGWTLVAAPVDEVDPFIGVDGGGNLLPGPVRPFGMVRLGPDCEVHNNNSGYATGKPIIGFSHNHLSGTGGAARYGNICVIPQTGVLDLVEPASAATNETASPGYYAVTLLRSGVRAELTSTARSGWHRYTFPDNSVPRMLIDVSRGVWTKVKEGQEQNFGCDGTEINVVNERTIEGVSHYSGGWGGRNPYSVYWTASFASPFVKSGTWTNLVHLPEVRSKGDRYAGVWVEFPTDMKTVLLKVGISYKCAENARKHADEKSGFDFDGVVQDSREEWNRHLRLLEVTGGDKDLRKVFYTALYRTFLVPADLTGDNPGWDSSEPHYWDYYAIWDTFRCLMPLHTLLVPKRQQEVLRCLLDIYTHKGWIPDVWTAGGWGMVQGGTDVDVAFADAAVKNLGGFDLKKALEGMRKNGEQEGMGTSGFTVVGRWLTNYAAKGWVESEMPLSVSHTLEYSYNDFCIAQVAQKAGDTKTAEMYYRRATNCYNLFQPDTKFFWGRKRSGEFEGGFDPNKVDAKTPSDVRMFYEGSAWNYSTYVPQDMAGLIARHGGDEAFVIFLDRLFDGKHFEMGNEPGFLQPYQYIYAGRPDRAAKRVRDNTATFFRPERKGWPGNDDSGAMSAWYLFGVLGFYPVAGQNIYLLSSPLFPEANMTVGDGRVFVIKAPATSIENKYIVAATLNGNPLNRAWLRHEEIIRGGVLELNMASEPNDWGKVERPPSMAIGAR